MECNYESREAQNFKRYLESDGYLKGLDTLQEEIISRRAEYQNLESLAQSVCELTFSKEEKLNNEYRWTKERLEEYVRVLDETPRTKEVCHRFTDSNGRIVENRYIQECNQEKIQALKNEIARLDGELRRISANLDFCLKVRNIAHEKKSAYQNKISHCDTVISSIENEKSNLKGDARRLIYDVKNAEMAINNASNVGIPTQPRQAGKNYIEMVRNKEYGF